MKPKFTGLERGMPRVPMALSATLALLMVGASFTSNAEAGLFRASPAKQSKFIDKEETLKRDRSVPFQSFWRNPDPKAWARVQGFNKVAVEPINTSHLRGRDDLFYNKRTGRKDLRPVGEMSRYMQQRFSSQLARNGKHIVKAPGKDTLVWEFALVELNPANVPGNVAKTGAQFIVPGAAFVGSQFTHGKIAIEGKLKNGETGETLLAFADRSFGKTAPFSFRDFSPYAHNRRAVNEWATQVGALSKSPRTARLPGHVPVTLNPF